MRIIKNRKKNNKAESVFSLFYFFIFYEKKIVDVIFLVKV